MPQGKIIDVETRSTPFIFEGDNCVMVAVHFVGTDKLLANEYHPNLFAIMY